MLAVVISSCAFAAPLPPPYKVTNCKGDFSSGSLRYVISSANAYTGTITRTISFDVTAATAGYSTGESFPGLVTNEAAGKSWFRIIVSSPLTIETYHNNPIFIDGSTQTREATSSNKKIEIRSNFANPTDLFHVKSSNAIIKDLAINKAGAAAGLSCILLDNVSHDAITSCYIGTTATGEAAGPLTSSYGIAISGESNKVSSCLISNNSFGIYIYHAGTTNNEISGNLIGTNAGGNAKLPNGSGVVVDSCNYNVIGKGGSEGNVISGNSGYGIRIRSGAAFTKLYGNIIGLDGSGTNPLGNSGHGIYIYNGGNNNIIGGTSANYRNVISANGGDGIYITNVGSDSNEVLGNYIGTTANGLGAAGNAGNGIRIYTGTKHMKIGDGTEFGRNVIAGNLTDGILVRGSQNNSIMVNYIGIGADQRNLGNERNGILSQFGSFNNFYYKNVISANGTSGNFAGIAISTIKTTSETISQNSIYGNTDKGIILFSGANRGISTPEVSSTLYNFATGGLQLTGLATANAVVEVFKSSGNDGRTYLGAVTANSSGAFNSSLAGVPLAPGDSVVVTATDTLGDTSEFSPPRTITGLLPASFGIVAPSTASADQAFAATITAKNASGSTETSIAGNTTLTVDDGTISPTTIVATAFASGVWSGNITLSKPGSRTITVTNTSANGTATVLVLNAAKQFTSADLGIPGMTIDIPTGAASQDVTITASETTSPGDAPAGYMIGGKVFNITGTPSTFLVPITITIPINGPLADPSVYWWDGTKWTKDGITIVSYTNTSLTFTVSHFTIFTSMGALPSNLVRFGPNPYNPNKGAGDFWYWLDASKDTSLYLTDLGGTIVWKNSYSSGANGAKLGENNISYDGKTSWGDILGNGVYLYKIIQDGKSIGGGKIAVIK